MANFGTRQDANQFPAMFTVQGTLGTADTQGTAPLVNLGADPSTGALYVYNLGPAGEVTLGDITGGTIDNIASGTLDVNILSGSITAEQGDLTGGTLDLITLLAAGTITRLEGGTVTVANPTGTTVQFNNGTVNSVGTIVGIGTATNIGSITNIGMLHGGTVETSITMTDTPGGTLDLVTRVGNIGTLELGTVVVSTLPNVTLGAAVPAGNNNIGDVDVATLPNTPGGTLGLVTRVGNIGTLELGTVAVSSIAAGDNNIGNVDVVTIPQVSVGTIPQVSVGTIPNIPGGTITLVSALAAGSIAVTAGTVVVNPRPATQTMLSSTAVGTAAIGTLVAAPGASTGIYVTGLSLKVGSGTLDLSLGFGTAISGTTVLERALISPTSGIVREFSVPNNAGQANLPLVYNINGGAGTAYWAVEYFTATA